MARVSEYPLNPDQAIVRGDPLTIPIAITHKGDPVDLTGSTWVSQIRRNPDGPLITEFLIEQIPNADLPKIYSDAIRNSPVPCALLMSLTAIQTRMIRHGNTFDLSQVSPVERTLWIVTKIRVRKDVSHA